MVHRGLKESSASTTLHLKLSSSLLKACLDSPDPTAKDAAPSWVGVNKRCPAPRSLRWWTQDGCSHGATRLGFPWPPLTPPPFSLSCITPFPLTKLLSSIPEQIGPRFSPPVARSTSPPQVGTLLRDGHSFYFKEIYAIIIFSKIIYYYYYYYGLIPCIH
jgi:hypothetical protein